MRIAALDDDQAQLEAIERALAGAGYRCQTFALGNHLVSALRRDSFDLLLLDWTLPDMTGPEVIAWVNANLPNPPPMLLLTARSSEEDVIEGLNAGADDYVVKPVQPAVLNARVAALLRRAYAGRTAGRAESFGDYAFDMATETVTIRATPGPDLTSKEFGLALLLFRNGHRALSRAHILEAVWGRNPDLPTRTLDMHISRLRSKLHLRPENGFRLAPVYSYGYRLERLDDGWPGDGEAAAE